MRIPRSIQLMQESGSVHKFWRCQSDPFVGRTKGQGPIFIKKLEKAWSISLWMES